MGEAAERRAIDSPDRVVREFKRRIGDETPIIVGDLRRGPGPLRRARPMGRGTCRGARGRTAVAHHGVAPRVMGRAPARTDPRGARRRGARRRRVRQRARGGRAALPGARAGRDRAGHRRLRPRRRYVRRGDPAEAGGRRVPRDRGSHGTRAPRRSRLRPADLRARASARRHGVRRRRRAPARRGARAGAGAARLRRREGGALVRLRDGRARAPARRAGARSARALRVRADDRRRPPPHGRDAPPCGGGGGPRARRTHRRPPDRRVVADSCDRTAHLGRTRAPRRRRRRSQGLHQHGRRGGGVRTVPFDPPSWTATTGRPPRLPALGGPHSPGHRSARPPCSPPHRMSIGLRATVLAGVAAALARGAHPDHAPGVGTQEQPDDGTEGTSGEPNGAPAGQYSTGAAPLLGPVAPVFQLDEGSSDGGSPPDAEAPPARPLSPANGGGGAATAPAPSGSSTAAEAESPTDTTPVTDPVAQPVQCPTVTGSGARPVARPGSRPRSRPRARPRP